MTSKSPPFYITSSMLSYVADIGELVGKASFDNKISMNPTLRRENRIRTIYSSLAIEQNTLDMKQITAVLSGKHVIAPPKDIAEVKNAFEIYENMDKLNPYSVDDLLAAHGIMTRGVVEESGQFRSRPVGVVDNKGNVVHFGTLPQYVPDLICQLLDWVKNSDAHMLMKSCVFHYEFELIHPFADGNGRMGRLWHTLLLSKWNPIFAWLPVESIIHDHQSDYYAAINTSNDVGESTNFVEFMLSVIKEALTEAVHVDEVHTDKRKSKSELRADAISSYLHNHACIMNADVQRMLDVSPATANRILLQLCKQDILEKVRNGSHWGYTLSQKK